VVSWTKQESPASSCRLIVQEPAVPHRQRARVRRAPLLQAKEIQNEKCIIGIAACEATGRRQWCSANQRRLQNLQPLCRVESDNSFA